jgi:hypothetical protein
MAICTTQTLYWLKNYVGDENSLSQLIDETPIKIQFYI